MLGATYRPGGWTRDGEPIYIGTKDQRERRAGVLGFVAGGDWASAIVADMSSGVLFTVFPHEIKIDIDPAAGDPAVLRLFTELDAIVGREDIGEADGLSLRVAMADILAMRDRWAVLLSPAGP